MSHPHTCPLCSHRRLLLQGAAVMTMPALGLLDAQAEGVEVGKNSMFTKLVPAETIERSAAQQYAQMMQQAANQNALAGRDHPQVKRLRSIANKTIPHALGWNPRAANWRWEVNLIGSKQINAFCMPGGKIAFYTGILEQLKLTDDEVATVMGHEVAHALREHARERMGKTAATGIGASLLGAVLGLGELGQTVTNYGAQLLTLQFSRSDESEADLVGMELAARAGFDPRAGVSLWQKMAQASKGAPPQWLSTHPSGSTRIADIEANLPKVLPLYARAQEPLPGR
ncbi:MAG: M48 family metallopeptidase [Rhodoferax sp.]|jgi:predicted Zn-dependent protease|nr:M48 family metallopeptidase [Rhodoferax sp.]MBP9149340.1 M48 family metallopeptidase [Rhodoferax sp.]MBP9736789.1 M48 family metallopeptidase [Rhodoferax sp.]